MRHASIICTIALLCISLISCDNGITKQTLPDGGMLVLEGSQAKGLKKIYSPDGALVASIEIKDSIPNGKCVYYYSNGKAKSTINSVNGKKDGLEVSYYLTGKKAKEVTFKNGRRDGRCCQFYPSGKLKSEQTFALSKGLGDLKEYTEDGTPITLAALEVTVINQIKTSGRFSVEAKLNPVVKGLRMYMKYPVTASSQPYKKIKTLNGVGTMDIYRLMLDKTRELEVLVVYKTEFGNECKISQIVTLK